MVISQELHDNSQKESRDVHEADRYERFGSKSAVHDFWGLTT